VRCPHCARLLRIPEGSAPPGAAAARETDASDGDETTLEEPPKGFILVADSLPSERAAAAAILQAHGYQVIEAGDGEEAVRLAREQRPDLIVADIRLPKLSGFQVVRALKDPFHPGNAECWRTPVILTTHKLRGKDTQYALHLGVGALLAKPITPADLCSRVERLLSARRRQAR
jgi:CheY-like chemotaxis protein